jgi:hypothetical protein
LPSYIDQEPLLTIPTPRIREGRREFEAGCAPGVVGLNAQPPLPRNGRQLARRRDGTCLFTHASYVNTSRDAAGTVGYPFDPPKHFIDYDAHTGFEEITPQ